MANSVVLVCQPGPMARGDWQPKNKLNKRHVITSHDQRVKRRLCASLAILPWKFVSSVYNTNSVLRFWSSARVITAINVHQKNFIQNTSLSSLWIQTYDKLYLVHHHHHHHLLVVLLHRCVRDKKHYLMMIPVAFDLKSLCFIQYGRKKENSVFLLVLG